ncbi:membrane-spanning 4-domains subfamily A member 4A-like [Discoglossus pictus]
MPSQQSDAGGVVVVTQVSPQNSAGTASGNENTNVPTTKPTPKRLTKFFSGEPEVLGVTQIFTAVFIIVFGIVICCVCSRRCYHLEVLIYSGMPFWCGISFLTSGSLSVAAFHKPTIGKVRSSLVLNTISSVIAAVAIIIFIISFIASNVFNYRFDDVYCAYYPPEYTCEGSVHQKTIMMGMTLMVFIFTILEFCVSVSSSVFACKAVCVTSYSEMTVVIYQSAAYNAGSNTAAASSEPSAETLVKTQ